MNDTLSAEFYKLFYENDLLYTAKEEQPLVQVIKPKSALDEKDEESIPSLPTNAPYPYKIVVLVDQPKQPELLPSEGVLLYKILKAVGYDSEDTDIVNVGFLSKEAVEQVMQGKTAHYVISFGVPFRKVMIDLMVPPYEAVQSHGVSFLLADPLSVVEADVAIKKRLWNALRTMFPVG